MLSPTTSKAPAEVAGSPTPRRADDRLAPSVPEVDVVDRYGADSFPASDPPGWWSGRGD